ncbi:eukaryotic initiation factor 3, gamma subunit [Dictyocaulus viviparus]|uniref:tRNA (adenine(58)-N(1))-methyltransferase non-catalytic subunit TRM6 n=1 Tax=Dictyocaulus viviparus TaxID=29172 RepID=A0A0D8XPX0_DICVI|nr:eukaryotic initiation factor 3, gamma subunit [Dictyocaulus viviparus]
MNERSSTCDSIEKGDYVVIQKVGGEHIRVMQLVSKQKVLIEKLRFDADSVFGHPYGLFEISSGKSVPMCAPQIVMDDELRGVNGGGSESIIPIESNKDLNPAQKLQKLTQEDVLSLKGQGITAGQLVSMLVEGNKSFSTRTEYGKSKYIRRKTKKHSDRVLILKPTIRLLARSYYMKDCTRVSNLRVDQLGMILQLAGVHYGKNVLVFDQVLGLVSAAVIDRLGGNGSCIHLHRGLIAQSIPCVHSMNFNDKIFSTFLPVRIASVLGGETQKYEHKCESVSTYKDDIKVDEEDKDDSSELRKADRLAREMRGLTLLEVVGVDALIIATKTVDPVSVLEAVFEKLRPCGAIVIYGSVMEPVLEAYRWLMDHSCVNVRLSDQLFRIQQVLPDRTRPLMAQFVAGGQLLSGIKVIPTVNHINFCVNAIFMWKYQLSKSL